jgi:heme/copper-type cytochrome/quinol oxidase subunit 3
MSTLEHDHEQEHSAPSHHLPPALVAHQQRRAVLFFILADAIFFACLLFSYFYLRSLNVDNGWLPDNANTAASWQVWLVAGIAVLSALAYRGAELGIRAGHRQRFQTGALLGLVLVIASIGVIIYQAMTWPILMSDGSYASIFIVLTYTQLVHVLILLVVAIGIWNRGLQGKLDSNYNHATVVGYFWYWVTLTAVLGACTTFFVR